MSNISKERKFSYLLDLFIELDAWGRKHDIKFFLDWGTLLGAIRHKGFIPWDFDLDIAILWGDYQKMLAAWESDPLPGRDMVNIYRYKDYPALFTRFVDTTTTEIRKNSAWDMGPNGMSLDIFTCVPVPKGKHDRQEFEDKFIAYYELKNPIMMNKGTRSEGMRKIFKKYRRKARFVGIEKVLKQLEDELFAYPEEECEEYIELTGGWRGGAFISKELIGDFTEIPFEGHMSYVPEKYIEYTQYCYGPDWRNFPRNRHADSGYNYTENLDIPYPVYVDDYMQFLDKDEVISTFKKSKKVDMSSMLRRNVVSTEYYVLKLDAYVAKIESFGSPSQYQNPTDAPKELQDTIARYAKDATSGKIKYWDAWASMKDEWFSFVCSFLWETNRNYLLYKIINRWLAHENRALPVGAQTCKDDNDFFIEILNAIDYMNVEKVREMSLLMEEHHFTPWRTDIVNLFLLRNDIEDSEGAQAFIDLAKAAYSRKSSSSEIKHYYAFALCLEGNSEEALPIFQEVLDKCEDGMILQRAAAERTEAEIG